MEKRFDKFLCETGGVTCTSAQHMCALSNEVSDGIIRRIGKAEYVSTTLQIVGSSEINQGQIGVSDISNYRADLEMVARLHAFNAWFRKAIEAHQANRTNVIELTFEDYCKMNNIVLEKPKCASTIPTVVESLVLEELGIGEYLQYLEANATASVYGKMIHPDRPLSNARENMDHALAKPVDYKLDGANTIIVTRHPSVDVDKFNELYYTLQGLQRSADKEKNGILAKVKDATEKTNLEITSQNQVNMSEYHTRLEEYNSNYRKAYLEYTKYIQAESAKAAKLHLVRPDKFKEIWEYLTSLENTK